MADEDVTSSDFMYDVFLSFRGRTRYSFTDHLYQALCRNEIETFRDVENLSAGDEIRPSLINAIENSRMSMVVLCEDYASSTWCLDELAMIIECHENKGKHVLAIVYKVKPSDVWEQKNSYEAAMTEHENRFGRDSERVKAWRSALSKVFNLSREHCENNTNEPEFIKKIVKDTSAKLPPLPLEIKKHVVGLDTCCEQVKSLLDIYSNDNVCMLEIYGAGGIGKTTFANYLYNKIKRLFEAACFLENVREKSTKSIKGLENLQKTLLSDMGEETETILGSTFKGGNEIKRRLGHKRVLLILDDVNSIKQLESLAGGRDWFGSGSRIIITTRDTNLLDKHLMGDVIVKKYEMKELNDGDSLELFCWHAFNRREPAENLADVSNRALSYAKGFPLALEVIGSHLKSFTRVEEWEVELEKYRNVPNAKIQGVLEVSYNSLYELDQKTFLDIACFFKGEKWEYVKRVLKACDFYPIIRVFISKCLITVNKNGCLEMHDLIQDMGKKIVRKETSDLGSRSRLWSYKDILQVLKDDSGSSSIEGIMLHPPTHEEVDHWTNTAFEKMKNLRILIVRNTIFPTGPSHLPNSLRLLDWKGYPSESFPLDFYPHRIVDFKLPHSHLKLERSFQGVFEDLTFINVSQCQSITQVPDVSGAKNLRVLTLDRCHKLVRFDESVGFMPNLVYLSASECNALQSFVSRMYLPSLEVLSFNFCRRFELFPDVMQRMDKPLKIFLINTAIKEFPKSIGNLTGLQHIDMSICGRLKDLSSSFLLLPKLVTLTIEGCSQLGESFKWFKRSHSKANGCPNLMALNFSGANLSDEDLYAILKTFPKLEDLNVSHNDFISLPECIKGSSHLKTLDVSYCSNLMEIPELPLSIQKIDARYCESLTSDASTGLWSKVLQEIKRIQVVMPKKDIPNWFDYVGNKDIPLFWARRKFPIVAIVFVFGGVNDNVEIKMDTSEFLPGIGAAKSHTVGLNLFIDGQEIFRKDYSYFSVGEEHVLLCDLQVLFNDEEWQGLDACVGDDWKAVQVQCESQLTLSQWGVYLYKQATNTDDIQFRLPNPNSSGGYMPSPHLVPKRTPEQSQQRIRYVTENFSPREIFGEYLPLLELEENPFFTRVLLRSWRNAKVDSRGEASASAYGASSNQEHEESPWDVVRVVDLMKENVPKHIADSYSDDIKSAHRVMEEVLRARVEFMKENGQERLDIDMPIVLEECHSDEAPSRRYWGRLEIKHGNPMFKAVLRRTNQLAWRFWNTKVFKERVNIVLLKCQHPSMEEGSSSGNGESLEQEYNDLVLEGLMSRIEQDAMNLNTSYGNLKASIVLTDEPISDKYLMEFLFLRGPENLERKGMSGWGMLELGLLGMLGSGMSGSAMLGSKFKKTPYGRLRVEHDAQSSTQKQQRLVLEHDVQRSPQNQEQHQLRVEHDVQHNTQKQHKLMVEDNAQSSVQNKEQRELKAKYDAQCSAQKQHKLIAEQNAQSGTQNLEQPELKAEHDAQPIAQNQQQDELMAEHNAQSGTQNLDQPELKAEHDAQPTAQNQQQDELKVEHDAQSTTQNQRHHKQLWTKILRCILCCK